MIYSYWETNFDVFFFYRKRKTCHSLFRTGYLICQNKKDMLKIVSHWLPHTQLLG